MLGSAATFSFFLAIGSVRTLLPYYPRPSPLIQAYVVGYSQRRRPPPTFGGSSLATLSSHAAIESRRTGELEDAMGA